MPHKLQNKVVDHCLLELLGYGNGANHAILRLVFKNPQVQASPWGPANVQGVTMELEVQDEARLGTVEGQLVVKTFRFTGPHRRACISYKLLVQGHRTVSDFMNVANKANLTPCDFYFVGLDIVGCRDFT